MIMVSYNYTLPVNLVLLQFHSPTHIFYSPPVVTRGTFMRDLQRAMEAALTMLEHCTTHIE